MTVLICNGCKKEIVGDVEVHDAFCERSKALRRKTYHDFVSRKERMAEICEKKDSLLSNIIRLRKELSSVSELNVW